MDRSLVDELFDPPPGSADKTAWLQRECARLMSIECELMQRESDLRKAGAAAKGKAGTRARRHGRPHAEDRLPPQHVDP